MYLCTENYILTIMSKTREDAIKRLHPDYFTTLHYKDIAEWHCQLVGNSFLLDIPDMVAVIVHRAYSDKDYEYYKRKWLACGERVFRCLLRRTSFTDKSMGIPHAAAHHLTRTVHDA